jgi:hypothetical protein
MGAYNAVRVGDLEIAAVLAREFRSIPGRPSLTLAQLQAAFGAFALDSEARERIDAALEAAGIHAEPSVLQAHPDEALLFSVAGERPRRRFTRPAAEPSTSPEPSRPPIGILVTALLLAVACTSVGGWPFGLAFVALAAISAAAAPRRSARP